MPADVAKPSSFFRIVMKELSKQIQQPGILAVEVVLIEI
jgi:hypothetical protein